MKKNKITLPVTAHTDYVGPGTTFVVIQGFTTNGAQYIPQALAQGATTIVVETGVHIPPISQNILVNRVSNARQALAELSAQAWGFPARRLKIFGVTGTKGKTTTCFVLDRFLSAAGYRTGLITTAGSYIAGVPVGSFLTTPSPDHLHALLAQCVQQQVSHVVLEVSAHALSLYRVFGIEFAGIIFTNLDQEHQEFYSTLEEYYQAKLKIFDQRTPGAWAIVNGDNEWAVRAAQERENSIILKTPSIILDTLTELIVKIELDPTRTVTVKTGSLCGVYNSYNIGCAVLCAYYCAHISLEIMADALREKLIVPGRFEQILLNNRACAIIDYAHNPSSYHAVLQAVRPYTDNLIIVFGCGGERDSSKRPIMGSIAAQYGDTVIITSDNPRSEDPAVIIADIYKGVPDECKNKIVIEPDRAQALRIGYSRSGPGSIIMILGKGPDEYQLIKGIKYPFSERVIMSTVSSGK